MAKFLLIHGACHGAWCWRDVLPLLNRGDNSATAIDLPGLGNDQTPPEEATLDACAKAIVNAIDEPVILVGHSLGGLSISAAAELAPEKIRRLVYVAAWAPLDGESGRSLRERTNAQSLQDATRLAEDKLTFSFGDDYLETVFYQDCPHEAVAYARAHIRPQPTAPAVVPLHLSARHDSVPRSYIRCLEDRAIPPAYQIEATRDWPSETVHDMHTDHSPFFSQPARLAEILIEIAETS
ncbi:MAG: alpha/beta fold hydrolase [Rhodobacteraceae bacterium]|nr:alpha/beta fold hydrolase [Paracoccaceae bacterium]